MTSQLNDHTGANYSNYLSETEYCIFIVLGRTGGQKDENVSCYENRQYLN